MTASIEPSADVSPDASIGPGCSVWHLAQVREGARLGADCVVGRGAYVDVGVAIGERCKIQNHALVYAPSVLEDGVFIGPGAVLTNDRHPRAIEPGGSLKNVGDWEAEGVVVRQGASIGARAVILPGVEIGSWAMVGAGAVVTRDVAPHALVVGTPARRIGWVGRSGRALETDGDLLVDPGTAVRYEVADGAIQELP